MISGLLCLTHSDMFMRILIHANFARRYFIKIRPFHKGKSSLFIYNLCKHAQSCHSFTRQYHIQNVFQMYTNNLSQWQRENTFEHLGVKQYAVFTSTLVMAHEELNPPTMTHRLKAPRSCCRSSAPPSSSSDRDCDKHPPAGWGPTLRHSAGRQDKVASARHLPMKGQEWVVIEFMMSLKALRNNMQSCFLSRDPVNIWGNHQQMASSSCQLFYF